jgi:hypothetical protein
MAALKPASTSRSLAHDLGRQVQVETGEGVERLAQHGHRNVGRPAQVDPWHGAGIAAVDGAGHLGDLLGLVADAFEVGDGLHYGHDHAQVDRCRLALGDDMVAGFVELDFVPVDLAVGSDHLFDQRDIAGVEAFHGANDLLLDQAAHGQIRGCAGLRDRRQTAWRCVPDSCRCTDVGKADTIVPACEGFVSAGIRSARLRARPAAARRLRAWRTGRW